jgi:hypothetical protein
MLRVWLAVFVLLAGCKKESRRDAALAAQSVRERLSALERKTNPQAWTEKRRRTEQAARTPPDFIYQGDSLAIRSVSAEHKQLITGRIDVRGIRQPDGSCKQDSRDQPRVNPTSGLFSEVGQVNFRTCAIQIWVIDPHIPEYGPMSSDTTVYVVPR